MLMDDDRKLAGPDSQPANVAMIDGLPISLNPPDEILAHMDRAIAEKSGGGSISITNTESMYHGLRIAEHGDYIRQSVFSLCDGVGVIVAGLAWGYRIHRFNGPVLQLECSKYGLSRGWRHFFYGGKEGVAEEMACKLKAQFPGLEVCGTFCPPFHELSAEEREAVIRRINDSKPDIVWVGLGLLKQEKWIAEFRDRIDARWMVGVGAAFDYHAGAVPWAPSLLRSLGLEWLFRLVLQPKLRAKRYWWSLVYVLQATIKGVIIRVLPGGRVLTAHGARIPR